MDWKVKINKYLFQLFLILSWSLNLCAQDINIGSILITPKEFKPVYKLALIEDYSYHDADTDKTIVRKGAKIILPSNLNRREVENNLVDAAREVYKEFKPNGISVFAYEEGDSLNTAFTIAMLEFAPYGEWDKSDAMVPLNKYKIKIKVIDSYFEVKPEPIDKSEIFFINKDTKWDRNKQKFVKATHVPISRSINSWVGKDIIIEIPNGTEAVILEENRQKLTGGELMIRVKVKVIFNGREYIGWVHADEIIKK